MKTVLLASGGSGGHLAPAIALAQRLGRRGIRTGISTTRKGVDRRLQSRYPDLAFVAMSPARGNGGARGLLVFAAEMVAAVWESSRYLDEARVDLVLATGGFGCAPVATAACLLGIPLQIHESNSVPGRLASWFRPVSVATWVTRLLDEASYWRRSRRVIETGLPMRAEFEPVKMRDAKLALGLDPDLPVLTVFGGSQGSKALNQWAAHASGELRNAGIQVFCVCGNAGMPGLVPDSVRIMDFCDDMQGLYSASDFVIARSGSGTLSELAAFGVPSVLVPYPYAAADHQMENARRFVEAGCGMVLPEAELDSATALIIEWMGDSTRIQACRKNLERWHAGNAIGRLVDTLSLVDRGCGDWQCDEREADV